MNTLKCIYKEPQFPAGMVVHGGAMWLAGEAMWFDVRPCGLVEGGVMWFDW